MLSEPRFETFPAKKFIGKRSIMSFAANTTPALWQNFMAQKKHISGVIGTELYSLEIYPDDFFENFDPQKEFEKWAAVEVSAEGAATDDLELLTVDEGLYAVFTYYGAPEKAADDYRYIFAGWLPQSRYVLDKRPHFAIMGSKYRNADPESEEELWIPVREK